MKNRLKTIIYFMIIVVVIIVIYILFVTTIKKIIPNYEKQLKTYDNKSNEEDFKIVDQKMEELLEKLFYENEVEALSNQEIDIYLENETIAKICEYIGIGTKQVERPPYIMTRGETTEYGNLCLLYVTNDQENKIVFTEDMQNIYFSNINYGNSAAINNSEMQSNITVNEIIEQIRLKIEEMQINLLYDLNLNVVYTREYDISNTYYIEDTQNNLVIIYDVVQNKILRFTLGF